MQTERTREEHLAFCKQRAIAILNSGDLDGAMVSMLRDLTKWREPLYDDLTIHLLMMDGMVFCNTSDKVRHWINSGFM